MLIQRKSQTVIRLFRKLQGAKYNTSLFLQLVGVVKLRRNETKNYFLTNPRKLFLRGSPSGESFADHTSSLDYLCKMSNNSMKNYGLLKIL